MNGDDATRIYHEVLRNIRTSDADTPEERAYRQSIVVSVDRIRAEGGEPDPVKEWP